MQMNRIIYILLFAVVCAPALRAQSSDSADGATVKDGKLYSKQGDKLEVLTDNLKFPLDIEVFTNGNFKVADGKERKLLEGQVIRRDGWLLNPDGSVEPVFDHVAMNAGKVILVRDGQSEVLTQPMTFPNKSSINPDGSCVYPDGSHARLMDGQLFHLDGAPILSKDAITMKNGRVVVQKEGTLIPLLPMQIMGMNDGTRVRGDGYIQKHDGTTIQLQEGQTILLDGALVKR